MSVSVPVYREGVCPLTTLQLVDRILAFVEWSSARSLYRYQRKLARRIVQSLLNNDGSTITALFSRQSGKSETIACLGIGLPLIMPLLAKSFPQDSRFSPFTNGFFLGIFAPTQKHSGIIYMRIKARVQAQAFADEVMSEPDINVGFAHSRGDSFSYTNGSMVQAHTASPNVLNEGFTYHLLITDESQKFDNAKINKELRPMLASYNGTMVEIGTAFMSRCQFHTDIRHNLAEEQRSNIKNHFQFDCDQVVRDRSYAFKQDGKTMHLSYEKYIEKEIAKLGGRASAEANDAFRMNFLLRWEEGYTNALDMTRFKALGREDVELERPLHGGRYVAGIDVGKDHDSTWVTIGHVDTSCPVIDNQWTNDPALDEPAVYYHVTVVGWLVLQGNFETEAKSQGQYDKILSFLQRFPRIETLAIDCTGKGDAVFERLKGLLPGVECIPFLFTTGTKHQLYRWYFQEIAAKRFHYAAGPATKEDPNYSEFILQHEELVREYKGEYLQVFAGDEENGHDDAPDSAALMMWAAKQEGMVTIDMSGGSTMTSGMMPEVGEDTGRSALLRRGGGGRGYSGGRY